MGAGAAGARRSSRLVALFPILWTFWESLHLHDLRMPWLGRPFVGVGQLRRSAGRSRGSGARSRTPASSSPSRVTLELAGRPGAGAGARPRDAAAAGWCARPSCCRGRFRPWSRRSSGGSCSRAPPASPARCSARLGVDAADLVRRRRSPPGFRSCSPTSWKTTPFVALLLLAGLQNIDRSLYEAADGRRRRRPWRQFTDDHAAAAEAGAAGGAPLPHARRLPRLRRRLRDDRRRTGHGHRADRALHLQHAAAASALRPRRRRCR